MSGGTREIHRDDDPLATGTHDGADSATILRKQGADFKSCGVSVGLAIENETSGESSLVASVTEDEITTDDDLSWDNGDTYNVYITATKNSLISTQWVDVSRGWKSDKVTLEKGWRPEDVDLDRDGQKIFGPGQPEKAR